MKRAPTWTIEQWNMVVTRIKIVLEEQLVDPPNEYFFCWLATWGWVNGNMTQLNIGKCEDSIVLHITEVISWRCFYMRLSGRVNYFVSNFPRLLFSRINFIAIVQSLLPNKELMQCAFIRSITSRHRMINRIEPDDRIYREG